MSTLKPQQAATLTGIVNRLTEVSIKLNSVSKGLDFIKDDFYTGHTDNDKRALADAIYIIEMIAGKARRLSSETFIDNTIEQDN